MSAFATKYPKPVGKSFAYGTAGFRCPADVLDSTFHRMGMLGVLRSRSRCRLVVGLMVTASHNPVRDNGIKLVDVDGGMLAQAWEPHATALANADGADALENALAGIVAAASAEGEGGVVLVGRDTRPHSERLAGIAIEGVDSLGGEAVDCGVLTTPQLHHLVRHRNGAAGTLLSRPPTAALTVTLTLTLILTLALALTLTCTLALNRIRI